MSPLQRQEAELLRKETTCHFQPSPLPHKPVWAILAGAPKAPTLDSLLSKQLMKCQVWGSISQTDYKQQYSHKDLLGDGGSPYTFDTSVAFALACSNWVALTQNPTMDLGCTGTFSSHGYIFFQAKQQTALQNKFALNILMLDASVCEWPRK